MSDPIIRLETNTFRVVENDGEYVWERREGCDAMGVPRWRKIAIPAADTIAQMYQQFIFFEHVKLDKD